PARSQGPTRAAGGARLDRRGGGAEGPLELPLPATLAIVPRPRRNARRSAALPEDAGVAHGHEHGRSRRAEPARNGERSLGACVRGRRDLRRAPLRTRRGWLLSAARP